MFIYRFILYRINNHTKINIRYILFYSIIYLFKIIKISQFFITNSIKDILNYNFSLKHNSSTSECCLLIKDTATFAYCDQENITLLFLLNNKSTISLKGHTQETLYLIELTNKRLGSCSVDCTIKIWNYDNGECINTLEGHNDWVKCLIQLDENILLSCGDDGIITIWDLEKDIAKKADIECDKGTGIVESDDENEFISFNKNGLLIKWNVKTKEKIREIDTKLKDIVQLIKMYKETYIMFCENLDIYIINLEKEEIIHLYLTY